MSKKNQKAEGDVGTETTLETSPEVAQTEGATGGPKARSSRLGETPDASEGQVLSGIEIEGRQYPDLEIASLNENLAMELIDLRIASDLFPTYIRH